MNQCPAPKEQLGSPSQSSSVTGTYSYRNGRLVKISDEIPSVAADVSLGGKEDYFDEHLGDYNEKKQRYEPYHVKSKKDKARRMKELNLTEKGGRDVKPHGKVNYHDLAVKDRATVFVGRK